MTSPGSFDEPMCAAEDPCGSGRRCILPVRGHGREHLVAQGAPAFAIVWPADLAELRIREIDAEKDVNARLDVGEEPELSSSAVSPALLDGLRRLAAAGARLPWDWALEWVHHHHGVEPQGALFARRSPEFEALFAMRYREEFGDGVVVLPEWCSFTDRGSPPFQLLVRLVGRCAQELEPFERSLGWALRQRSSTSVTALAHLPFVVASTIESPELDAVCASLQTRLDADAYAVVDGRELVGEPEPDRGSPLRFCIDEAASVVLARLLECRGLGMEPDVRFGGRGVTTGTSVVFHVNAPTVSPGDGYLDAALVLNVVASVVCTQRRVSAEAEQFMIQLESYFAEGLNSHERTRFGALRRLLVLDRSDCLLGMARARNWQQDRREALFELVDFAVRVSGPPSLEAIGGLERVARVLDFEVPASVETHGVRANDHYGPTSEADSRRHSRWPVELDLDRLAAVTRETVWVSARLAETFSEDDAECALQPEVVDLGGFDEPSRGLLRALGQHMTWERRAFDELVAEFGLMPNAALDVLNEEALVRCGESVLEGDDPIEVVREVWTELVDE
jgi:hypothetical protein